MVEKLSNYRLTFKTKMQFKIHHIVNIVMYESWPLFYMAASDSHPSINFAKKRMGSSDISKEQAIINGTFTSINKEAKPKAHPSSL